MAHHVVTLRVTPCFGIDCKFWVGDDGWNGSSEDLSITVQAPSFEQAKSDMELALGKCMIQVQTSSQEVAINVAGFR